MVPTDGGVVSAFALVKLLLDILEEIHAESQDLASTVHIFAHSVVQYDATLID